MVGAGGAATALGRIVNKPLVIGCFWLTMALPAVAGSSTAEIIVGHVTKIHGDWRLYLAEASDEHARKLSPGFGVPAGAEIRINSPSIRDHIIITGLDIRDLEVRRCEVKDECGKPIFIPKETKPTSSDYQAVLSLAWSFFERNYKVSYHGVRGGPRIAGDGVVA